MRLRGMAFFGRRAWKTRWCSGGFSVGRESSPVCALERGRPPVDWKHTRGWNLAAMRWMKLAVRSQTMLHSMLCFRCYHESRRVFAVRFLETIRRDRRFVVILHPQLLVRGDRLARGLWSA